MKHIFSFHHIHLIHSNMLFCVYFFNNQIEFSNMFFLTKYLTTWIRSGEQWLLLMVLYRKYAILKGETFVSIWTGLRLYDLLSNLLIWLLYWTAKTCLQKKDMWQYVSFSLDVFKFSGGGWWQFHRLTGTLLTNILYKIKKGVLKNISQLHHLIQLSITNIFFNNNLTNDNFFTTGEVFSRQYHRE